MCLQILLTTGLCMNFGGSCQCVGDCLGWEGPGGQSDFTRPFLIKPGFHLFNVVSQGSCMIWLLLKGFMREWQLDWYKGLFILEQAPQAASPSRGTCQLSSNQTFDYEVLHSIPSRINFFPFTWNCTIPIFFLEFDVSGHDWSHEKNKCIPADTTIKFAKLVFYMIW